MPGATANDSSRCLELRVLGPLQVFREGNEVAFRKREKLAFSPLVEYRGEIVSPDTLMDLIWENDPPDTAEGMIYNTIHAVRGKLTTGKGPENPIVTVGRKEGYHLDLKCWRFDDDRFTELVGQARDLAAQGKPRAAWTKYGAALSLWRAGTLTSGINCPLTEAAARRLTRHRLAARREWCATGIRAGRHEDVLPFLEELAAAEPPNESVYANLMLALYRSGDQHQALAAFEELRERLHGAPGPALLRLRDQVKDHDPHLDLPHEAALT